MINRSAVRVTWGGVWERGIREYNTREQTQHGKETPTFSTASSGPELVEFSGSIEMSRCPSPSSFGTPPSRPLLLRPLEASDTSSWRAKAVHPPAFQTGEKGNKSAGAREQRKMRARARGGIGGVFIGRVVSSCQAHVRFSRNGYPDPTTAFAHTGRALFACPPSHQVHARIQENNEYAFVTIERRFLPMPHLLQQQRLCRAQFHNKNPTCLGEGSASLSSRWTHLDLSRTALP